MRRNHWAPMRLVGTLRGEGVLLAPGAKTPVTYKVDLYRRGASKMANGEVEGRMSAAFRRAATTRLRLADGSELDVNLRDFGDGLTEFDVDEAGAKLSHAAAFPNAESDAA